MMTYKKEYTKQKKVTFGIDASNREIVQFYHYHNHKKMKYRVGKKVLKREMAKIERM